MNSHFLQGEKDRDSRHWNPSQLPGWGLGGRVGAAHRTGGQRHRFRGRPGRAGRGRWNRVRNHCGQMHRDLSRGTSGEQIIPDSAQLESTVQPPENGTGPPRGRRQTPKWSCATLQKTGTTGAQSPNTRRICQGFNGVQTPVQTCTHHAGKNRNTTSCRWFRRNRVI